MLQWDSQEWRDLRDAKLREWFLGDEYAMATYIGLTHAAEVWDDLVDGDKPVETADVNKAFHDLLVGFQTNPFYLRFQSWITALSIVVENAFHDANELESSHNVDSRIAAFHLRRLGVEFACLFAFCVGGAAHLRKVSIDIRSFFYSESFMDWEREHEKQRVTLN